MGSNFLPKILLVPTDRGRRGGGRVWPESLKIPKDPSLPCSWMVYSLSFFPRPMEPLGSHGLALGLTLCNKLLPKNVYFRVNPLDFVSIFHSVHFSFPSLLPLPARASLAAGDEGGSGSREEREGALIPPAVFSAIYPDGVCYFMRGTTYRPQNLKLCLVHARYIPIMLVKFVSSIQMHKKKQ